MDRKPFGALGGTIPPGGHLMVSYEGDQRIHRETLAGLSAGIPPVATPLGFLLFLSGFPYVKDWYLAEGGMEGPRKLWGEKAPDAGWERVYREKTMRQILSFLERNAREEVPDFVAEARIRAEEVTRSVRIDEGM